MCVSQKKSSFSKVSYSKLFSKITNSSESTKAVVDNKCMGNRCDLCKLNYVQHCKSHCNSEIVIYYLKCHTCDQTYIGQTKHLRLKMVTEVAQDWGTIPIFLIDIFS